MISDFDTVEAKLLENADLCIIGTGAAGICIAREFFRTTFKVLVLEAGGAKFEQESQDIYRSAVVGLPHTGVHSGRARVFGGTTTLWAGQALPLSPIDFETRDWVPHSGWPLRFDEVARYYPRAEQVMRIPHFSYGRGEGPEGARMRPDYLNEVCQSEVSQFSNDPDFGRLYGAELRASENVHVITHANVVKIGASRDGESVESVEIRSLAGRFVKVNSRQYVLCCGAIETARLLLSSNDVMPSGLGNSRDLVGRYFQEHLHCVPVPVRVRNSPGFAAYFNAIRVEGIKQVPKIAATEAFQRSNRILNVGAEIVYPPDAESPIEAAKRLLRKVKGVEAREGLGEDTLRVLRSPIQLAGAAWRYFAMRQPALDTSGEPFLGICGEQAPNPDSRIRIGSARDGLGMPRAVVDWRLTPLEKRSICAFGDAVSGEFARLGLGTVNFSAHDWPDDPDRFGDVLHDSSHHIGTTRMSDSPNNGVVDCHCRVHGIRNFFVGSSSVFPTGGYSNPTLTILALCLRLSDHLKRVLSSEIQT